MNADILSYILYQLLGFGAGTITFFGGLYLYGRYRKWQDNKRWEG